MNLPAQISLMTVPQEFARLCNAVLSAEHGDDFLAIDDDRPDRGNDGYVKSERRMYAMHCFKRTQNQSLDGAIRSKMLGDLGKAITLKAEGRWEIDGWTFLCNYPVSEEIAAQVVRVAQEAGIDVKWLGPEYLADGLQKHRSIRAQFPQLQVNELGEQLEALQRQVGKLIVSLPEQVTASQIGSPSPEGIPATAEDRQALLAERPPGWEYLLFASVLRGGKDSLELKWRDYVVGAAARPGEDLDDEQIMGYLQRRLHEAQTDIEVMMRVFDASVQEEAFGLPGEPGDPLRIEHFARRILAGYERLMDWAARLRGVEVSDPFRNIFELTVRMVEQPVAQIREFIDKVVVETAKIPPYFASAGADTEPLRIELSLVLSVDDDVVAAVSEEMARVGASLS